jgi:hypothetical protein
MQLNLARRVEHGCNVLNLTPQKLNIKEQPWKK